MAHVFAEPLTYCDFVIVVDTREQAPYDFGRVPAREADGGGTVVIGTAREGLATGDYSIRGLEDQVAVERKTLEDLYGTLGKGRQRFVREFERLAELDHAAVVVEATWQEVCRPAEFRARWHSELDPRSAWGTIFAWSQRYPVVWWLMGSRRMGEIATFEILERFWRESNET